MIIVSVNSLIKNKIGIPQKGHKWIYIGKSFQKIKNIESILGKKKRFLYSELFQDILLNSRYEFIDHVNDAIIIKRDQVWWAHQISYLSPLVSDYYENFCHIKLIKGLSERKDLNLVVIIEDDFLFSQLCVEEFNNTSIISSSSFFLKIKRSKYFLYNYIKLIYSFLKSFVYLFVFYFYKITGNNKYINSSIVKISWIEDRCFQGGNFTDVYFKGIEKVENEIGNSFSTLSMPFIPIRLIKKSLHNEKIFPSAVFLSIPVIFRSLYKTLFFKPKFQKKNDYLLIREISNKNSMFEALIYYYIMKKFIKVHDGVTTIILPFENQSKDKLLVLAKQQVRSCVKIIGYQHASISYMGLNYCISKKLKKIIPLPDVIVATGNYSKIFFTTNNYSSEIINGGSLKYKDNISIPNRGDSVLVLLSYDLEQSLSFLNFIVNSNLKVRSIIVKPHPNFPERLFRENIDFPNNFKFVNCGMDEFFTLGKVVIHNGTTAAIECMNAGMYVYKYLSERIDLDPLLNTGVNQGIVREGVEPLINIQIVHSNLDQLQNDVSISKWKNLLFQ